MNIYDKLRKKFDMIYYLSYQAISKEKYIFLKNANR